MRKGPGSVCGLCDSISIVAGRGKLNRQVGSGNFLIVLFGFGEIWGGWGLDMPGVTPRGRVQEFVAQGFGSFRPAGFTPAVRLCLGQSGMRFARLVFGTETRS